MKPVIRIAAAALALGAAGTAASAQACACRYPVHPARYVTRTRVVRYVAPVRHVRVVGYVAPRVIVREPVYVHRTYVSPYADYDGAYAYGGYYARPTVVRYVARPYWYRHRDWDDDWRWRGRGWHRGWEGHHHHDWR